MTNNSALTPQSPPSHQILSRAYHFCYLNFQNSIPISKILSRLSIAFTARLFAVANWLCRGEPLPAVQKLVTTKEKKTTSRREPVRAVMMLKSRSNP